MHHGLEFFASETGQFAFAWPTVSAVTGLRWSDEAATSVLFYLAYALPLGAAVVLVRRRRQLPAAIVSVIAGMTALGLVYDAVILRAPLAARIPDLAAVLAILGTWCAVELYRAVDAAPLGAAARRAARAGVVAASAIALAGVGVLGHVRDQVLDTGLPGGPTLVFGKLAALAGDGTRWPWRSYWPGGEMPSAVEYLDACTTPDDRLFLNWFAPEYYVFGRRGFAAGQNILVPPSYSDPEDQRRALARLGRERVPLALVSENQRIEFERVYPLLAQYLQEHYRPAGRFALPNDVEVSVLVREDWTARSTFGDAGWPCGLAPPAPEG